MDRIDVFLDEVIEKTNLRRIHWERSAETERFVATIGGRFSLTLAGPSSIEEELGFGALTGYHLLLKDFSGMTIFEVSDLQIPSGFQGHLPDSPERIDKVRSLIDTVRRLTSVKDNALDDAMEELRKL